MDLTVKKRNGSIEQFNQDKISTAVQKAFVEVLGERPENKAIIERITVRVVDKLTRTHKSPYNIEDIQDIVEDTLIDMGYSSVAKAYIRYRYKREVARKMNTSLRERYNHLAEFVSGKDEESNKENSNKDTRILSTMRDYLAGFICREMADEIILPKDIAEAHKAGIIHFHDSDYSPMMPMSNCSLINLEDMLQNGTVISGTKIEKPHSFHTACTITTQVIAQVASSQYGGCTFSLAHLAPFVDISRQNIRKEILQSFNGDYKNNRVIVDKLVDNRLKKEIADGIQTIQYQLITLSTTNGQSPFVSIMMYLDEVPDGQLREDLAMLIEEVLKQRIKGVKNLQGVYITPAFPKLLYTLDEDNTYEGSRYFYLTKLRAECSAKRLVPDYISAKKMRELKGDVYPCINRTCA